MAVVGIKTILSTICPKHIFKKISSYCGFNFPASNAIALQESALKCDLNY